MIRLNLLALLVGAGNSDFTDLDRPYAIAVILLGLAIVPFTVFAMRRAAAEVPPKSAAMQRIFRVHHWGSLAVYFSFVLTPALLVSAGVVPTTWNRFGGCVLLLFNVACTFWGAATRRREVEAQAAQALPPSFSLPPGISPRVASLVAAGLTIPAIKAYREEHPGTGLQEAKEAIDRYASGESSRHTTGVR